MKVDLPKRRTRAMIKARDLVEKYNLDASSAAQKVRASRREIERDLKPDMRALIEEIIFAWGIVERLARSNLAKEAKPIPEDAEAPVSVYPVLQSGPSTTT